MTKTTKTTKNSQYENLLELFEQSAARFASNPLFGTKNKNKDYTWTSYGEIARRVDLVRSGLAKLGVKQGDAVGIIANNRTEWAIVAMATYGLCARLVPMYEAELFSVWKYIVSDAAVKVLFVSTPQILQKLSAVKGEIPTLEHLVLIDGQGEGSMAGLEKQGSAALVPSVQPAADDIAVLVYTSGTTGDPKGVLLSHGNLVSNVKGGSRLFPRLTEKSRSLSILPWAHSFGQTGELYIFIMIGGSIGFMESPQTVVEDIEKVKPTFLIAVPRVFNKIHDGVWNKINLKGGLAKRLFLMGLESARRKREAREGPPPKGAPVPGEAAKAPEAASQVPLAAVTRIQEALDGLLYNLADRVVFRRIRKSLGGQLEGAMTGSALMNPDVSRFFWDIGIPVFDAYGLSETSPGVTMNGPAAYKIGTVGKPIEGVKVVIDRSAIEPEAHDGEIVVYGPNVMQGYHNKPDKTKEVMTSDGGFRTGDRGWIDEQGFLWITGRIKEQYKLENGKYVFPSQMEEELKAHSWVTNACIYGEGKPFNICLIVPDFLALAKVVREKSFPLTPSQMVLHQGFREMMIKEVQKHLSGKFASYEIPKKIVLLDQDFSLDNGMLTPTLKLKRRVVFNTYAKAIETQYMKEASA